MHFLIYYLVEIRDDSLSRIFNYPDIGYICVLILYILCNNYPLISGCSQKKLFRSSISNYLTNFPDVLDIQKCLIEICSSRYLKIYVLMYREENESPNKYFSYLYPSLKVNKKFTLLSYQLKYLWNVENILHHSKIYSTW